MSWYKRAKNYLNDSNIDIRERQFMLLAVIALFGIKMASLVGLIIGENIESVLITFGEFVFFSALCWVAFHFNKIIIVSYIVAFILVVILMPVNFFTGGAVHGGAIAWSVFDVFYILMVLRDGRE